MIRKLRPRSIYDVFAVLGLVLAAGGTSAYAANTVFSSDIVDGEVKAVDIGNGEVGSADVKDNSINTFDVHSFLGADIVDGTVTGADVDEAALGTVPASVLGGLGRSGLRQNGGTGPGSCDPESPTFVNCDISARLDLARPARVLVIGSVRARNENGTPFTAVGDCLLGTTSGPVPGTRTTAVVEALSDGTPGDEHLALAGVTGVFPPGQHHFGVDCNEALEMSYWDATVTAVALSDQ